jgi:hypothetical protein
VFKWWCLSPATPPRLNPVRAARFFELTTRYSGAENRLTAALAAVLAQAPELALALARDWTDPHEGNCAPGEVAVPETADANEALRRLETHDNHGLLQIRTQVTSKQKHVDLELRFGPEPTRSPNDVLIWLEAKAGSQPYPDQLASYRDRLRERIALGAVILLAPRPDLPYGEELVPRGVPQRSWQATTPRLRKLRVTANDPVRFLVDELDGYMTDRNLTLPEAIGPEHLVALAYWNQAEEALVAICEETSRLVKQTWGQPDQVALDRRRPFYGWGYWEAWTRSGQRGSGEWIRLEWAVLNDPSHPEVDGRSLAFVSGLAAEDPERLTATPDDLERSRRLEDGVALTGGVIRFERFVDPDGTARLSRVGFPEEVLHGRTLEDQAKSLGDWITTAFDLLSRPLDELVDEEGQTKA